MLLDRLARAFLPSAIEKKARNSIGPIYISPSRPEPSTLNPVESARNYNISANMRSHAYQGLTKNRVDLPGDVIQNGVNLSHEHRVAAYFRQSAMPWGSHYMPPQSQYLNNVSQQSFNKQRRLNVGSDYSKFYAMMHAISAAFGDLQAR